MTDEWSYQAQRTQQQIAALSQRDRTFYLRERARLSCEAIYPPKRTSFLALLRRHLADGLPVNDAFYRRHGVYIGGLAS